MTSAPPVRHDPTAGSRLTISRAARLAGLTVRAIRHYEERGLVLGQRDVADNRTFGAAELDCLVAIAELRTIGVSLGEISGLVADGALAGGPAGSQRLSDLLSDHRRRLLLRLSCLDAIARREGFTLARDDRPAARGRRAAASRLHDAGRSHA